MHVHGFDDQIVAAAHGHAASSGAGRQPREDIFGLTVDDDPHEPFSALIEGTHRLDALHDAALKVTCWHAGKVKNSVPERAHDASMKCDRAAQGGHGASHTP